MWQAKVALASGLVAALVCGCSRRSAEEAPTTPEPPSPVSGVVWIDIDAALLAACRIAPAQGPFAFDSAVIDPPEGTVVRRLAHCLARGPHEGRKIRLVVYDVGHERERFVRRFGKSRAQSVRDYLMFHGVDRAAIAVESPTDPAPAPRVEIRAVR